MGVAVEILDKLPEQLKKGDAINYDQTDWLVTDRSVYKESDDYREVQCTLYNAKQGERYLVRSEGKTDKGIEYTWVFTRAISIRPIQFKSATGDWLHLDKKHFVSAPPNELKRNDILFHFMGETSGKAKDDDGNMVTKLTWDYYDATGKQNLAIEIWKEEDGDYPEAYDGTVIDPHSIRILQPGAARRLRRNPAPWQQNVLYGLAVALVVWLNGVPMDICIAVGIPVLVVYLVTALRGVGWWLWWASAVVWMAMIILCMVKGSGTSYWVIAAWGVALATICARTIALLAPEADRGDYSLISFTGLLPALWLYSFFTYFKFAPGPHSAGQFLTACLLPSIPTAICYCANLALENMYVES